MTEPLLSSKRVLRAAIVVGAAYLLKTLGVGLLLAILGGLVASILLGPRTEAT